MTRTSAVIRGSSQCASRPSSTVNSTMVSGSGGNIGPDTGARLVGRRAGIAGGRIRDPRVVYAGEQRHERLLDTGQIAQGEVAVVELAFFEALADDPLDQVLDSFARMVARRTRRGLGAVREHQDRCLARLRPRPRIGKQRRVDVFG